MFNKISLESALKKVERYYPQVFFKECKYIDKTVIIHITDNSSDIPSSDASNEEHNRIILFLKENWACVSKNIEHYSSSEQCTQKRLSHF